MPTWLGPLLSFLSDIAGRRGFASRISSELNEVTRFLERFINLASNIKDLTRPVDDLTRSIQNLSQGIQNLNKPIVDATLAFQGLTMTSLRASETFISFHRNLLGAEDALSATAQTLSALSAGVATAAEGFQQITKVASVVETAVSNINQIIQQSLSAVSGVIGSFHTMFQSFTGMIGGFITSFAGIFNRNIASVMGSLHGFISTLVEMAAFFPTIYLPLTMLTTQLTSLAISFQRTMLAVQQFLLPIRFLSPLVEAYLKVVSELLGALGKLTMEIRNLIFQSLAPLQGQVLALSAAFSMTRGTIDQIAESMGRFGLTLQSVMEYTRAAFSQGVMPLQSMVNILGELALQFSYISGLTPDEVFRRLSQAVLEGNVSLLNQLNIMMTQADLLNILVSRYGLLVSSIQEIPPFIRQQIMLDIVGREREMFEREGPRSLLEIVGLLRGIYQQFLTFVGRVMSLVTFPQQIIDRLLESLRRLWSETVGERLGRALSTFVSFALEGLRPIIESLRQFLESPALTNITAFLSGIVYGLEQGVAQIIQRITEALVGMGTPDEIFAKAAAAAEAFALTLADAFPVIVQFIMIIGQAALSVVSNFGNIFRAISAAVKVGVDAFAVLGSMVERAVAVFKSLEPVIKVLITLLNFFMIGLNAIIGGIFGIIWGVTKAISWVVSYIPGIGGWISQQLENFASFLLNNIIYPMKDYEQALIEGTDLLWGRTRGQQQLGDPYENMARLGQSVNEAREAFNQLTDAFSKQDFSGQIQGALGQLGNAIGNFSRYYQEAYERLRGTRFTDFYERIGRNVESSFRNMVQVIQPVIEQFRNWRDLLLESIGVFSVILGEPGLRRVGDVFLNFPRTAEMGMAALETAYAYMRASSARLAVTLFAMATGARGAATSFFQEMNNFIKSIRDLNNTVIRITSTLGQSVRDLVGILLGQIRVGIITGGPLGGIVPAFRERIPGVIGFVGQRLGEIYQFMVRYEEIARREGFLGTPEYLSTMNQLYERFVETARQGAEIFRLFGEILSAESSALLSLSQLLSTVTFGLGNFNMMVNTVTMSVRGLFDQLQALYYRLIATILGGNLEEALRLVGQLAEQIRKVFFEEMPRAATGIAEAFRAPLDMWMSGLQQLRETLREVGAEGMVLPLAIRNAIPVLADLIRMFSALRDQAFAQGLIPLAMEFNNQLMRAQRQILEILGISGMFLPAYTPAEIVREREMWGMLPAGFVARMARGGIPALAPPVRVVPFGQLFRLLGLGFAPGMLGLFGPFMNVEGLFTLLNLTGLFTGLWGGYGFLGRVSPWMIWRNFMNLLGGFIPAPFLAMFAPSRIPLLGAFLGAFQYGAGRLIRPETMFTPEAWGRTVEVGRIIASQIVAGMISVTEDPQRRRDLEEIRRGILGAPVRYGPPTPPIIYYPTPTLPSPTVVVPLRAQPAPTTTPIGFEPSGPVEIPVRLALNADIVGRDGTVLDTITRELSTVVVLQPKVVRTLG